MSSPSSASESPAAELARDAALEEAELALGATEVFASLGVPDGDELRFFLSYAAITGEGTLISPPRMHVTATRDGRIVDREPCTASDFSGSLEGFVPAITQSGLQLPLARGAELRADFAAPGGPKREAFEALVPRAQWPFYEALSPGLLGRLGLS